MLLPHLVDVQINSVYSLGPGVCIEVRARSESARCPRCETVSSRVHSRYQRTIDDAAIGGRPASLRVSVRRFFCSSRDCAAVTFAAQIEGLTSRYGRRTVLARDLLEAIGLALAGRAGARLAALLGAPISRHTLLRLVRALPEPTIGVVAELGVDDFALRRGHHYGTVLIDLGSRQPVDLLEGRDADTLADWLRAHPGAQVVCRDRAGAYAEGARRGAADAVQVADRWHLWHNLVHAVAKTVARHGADLREPTAEPETPAETPDPPIGPDATENWLRVRTRERYRLVHDRLDHGVSLSAICRDLSLDRKTCNASPGPTPSSNC